MISRTLDFYFHFGTAVRFPQDARDGDRIADDAMAGGAFGPTSAWSSRTWRI
jgi:hypothetical protein